uniref:Retrotransposon Copia-like N-terminal domain-containing protein n=1 Tax=Fagus sylvatica TaxID=28930 RepID=A0A2N9HAX0_FAGSY
MLSPALPPSEIRSPRYQEANSLPKGHTATLGFAAPGLRSRHLRSRWKDLRKLDSTAQESTSSDVGHALMRRLNFRDNYSLWAQGMCSFLKGHKLWLYVTGQRHPPKQKNDETKDAFALRLKDWDDVNHQIITWLRNTSTPSVSMEFGGYDTAKDVWDMLASRYDQLAASEPVIRSVSDAKLVSTHRECLHLHQFLMGILDDFESETRLKSHRSSQPHTTVLATPASVDPTVSAPPRGHDKRRSNQKNSYLICAFCKNRGHTIDRCNMRACENHDPKVKWASKCDPTDNGPIL